MSSWSTILESFYVKVNQILHCIRFAKGHMKIVKLGTKILFFKISIIKLSSTSKLKIGK